MAIFALLDELGQFHVNLRRTRRDAATMCAWPQANACERQSYNTFLGSANPDVNASPDKSQRALPAARFGNRTGTVEGAHIANAFGALAVFPNSPNRTSAPATAPVSAAAIILSLRA